MGVSKVNFGDETIVDITDSTVTADTLAEGTVAYGADGERITGTLVSSLPIGSLTLSLSPTVPTGWLPCDGTIVAAIAYNDLWTHLLEENNYKTFAEWQALYDANEGNVPYWGVQQSGSQMQWRIRTPSIKGWVRGGSTSDVGTYLPAGLPNIEGQFRLGSGTEGGVTTSGSFYDPEIVGGSYSAGHTAGAENPTVSFDASLSNPIYGSADTVQPASVVGVWIVKVFDSLTNVASQDVADISAGLEAVAADVATLSSTIDSIPQIVDSYQDGENWYRKYSNGWIEQGGYTVCSKTYGDMSITLNTPFTDTKYTISVTPLLTSTGYRIWAFVRELSTTTVTGYIHCYSEKGKCQGVYWTACGY